MLLFYHPIQRSNCYLKAFSILPGIKILCLNILQLNTQLTIKNNFLQNSKDMALVFSKCYFISILSHQNHCFFYLLLWKEMTDPSLTSVNVFVSSLVHRVHIEYLLWPLINSIVYGFLTLQEPSGRLLCGTSVKAFLQVSACK